MPLYKRKPIERAQTPDWDVDEQPKRQVWQIKYTGEIFATYEEYLERQSLYTEPVWTCEVSGKQNLTYEQALASEKEHSNLIEDKFPDSLKKPILEMIQFETSRLDILVDDIYEKFKSRYVEEEKVYITIDGKRRYAKVAEVIPLVDTNQNSVENGKPFAETSKRSSIRANNEDLLEDPTANYNYRVHLLDGSGKPIKNNTGKSSKKYILKNVEGGEGMSRDRLAFNKNILKKFIKDSATKDSYVGAPWTVKPELARKYKISLAMPDELQKAREVALAKTRKRKGKALEELVVSKKIKNSKEQKNGVHENKRPEVKSKKEDEIKRLNSDKRDQQKTLKAQQKSVIEREKAQQKLKQAREAKKREFKIKYPIEDLELAVDPTLALKRPLLVQDFHVSNFENLIKTWNFLSIFGKPLGISHCTLDDFELSLRHSIAVPRCTMIVEHHCALLNAIIKDRLIAKSKKTKRNDGIQNGMTRRGSVSGSTSSTVERAGSLQESSTNIKRTFNEKINKVSNNASPFSEKARFAARQVVIKNFARTWHNNIISPADGRKGWEAVLIGCLHQLGTYEALPQLDRILYHLVPDESESTTDLLEKNYVTLDVDHKLAILDFLVGLVVTTSTIREFIEECVEKLAQLSKEKNDFNKERKRIVLARAEVKKSNEKPLKPEEEENGKVLIKKLDADEVLLKKQEERSEKEIRKYSILRQPPLGQDRFYNRYYYFDGFGSVISEKYGTALLVVRSPSSEEIGGLDIGLLQSLRKRRRIEQEEQVGCENGTSAEMPQWGYYENVNQVDELLKWLNPKGIRELELRNELLARYNDITAGMCKRQQDKMLLRNLQAGRRSTRTQTTNAMISQQPYMRWSNKLAR